MIAWRMRSRFVTTGWSVRINPLGALLRLARDSGRLVVLASDHGHVWHRPDAQFEPATEGSRWRHNEGDCNEGELVVSGKRVIPADSIIVPWSETIHHKRKQHGYHGGATPQEMVCPLVFTHRQEQRFLRFERVCLSKTRMVVASAGCISRRGGSCRACHCTDTGQRTLFDQLLPEEDKTETATEVHNRCTGCRWRLD